MAASEADVICTIADVAEERVLRLRLANEMYVSVLYAGETPVAGVLITGLPDVPQFSVSAAAFSSESLDDIGSSRTQIPLLAV